MSSVLGMAYREKKRGEMILLDSVEVSTESGVAGDFRGKPGRRQVTVLSEAQWQDACYEVDKSFAWHLRRANFLIDGWRFSAEDEGKTLCLGDEVRLLVTGQTVPCTRMDEIWPGLGNALVPYWRGGITCRVLQGGVCRLGDAVRWC